MPTTPHFGWTLPDPHGPNQYPEDMATLGDDIDATISALPALPALATFEEVLSSQSGSGTLTCDLSQARNFKLTATGNSTVALSNVPATGNRLISVTIALVQDATGGRTWTLPGSFRWGNSGAPSFSTAANKKDIVAAVSHDNGTTWDAVLVGTGY